MRFDEAYSGNIFIGAQQEYKNSRVVLYGMPMDWTVSYRPGSRFGPGRIREVSIGLEEYSPYLDRELAEVNYFDAGDIPLPFGNAAKSLDLIEDYIDSLLADGKFPLGMGGEHLVSWPVMKAIAKNILIWQLFIWTPIQISVQSMKANRFPTLRQSERLLN